MKKRFSLFKEFLVSQQGATATEYAVRLALPIAVVFGVVVVLGEKVDDLFVNAAEKIEEAIS